MDSSGILINSCPHPLRVQQKTCIIPHGTTCLEMLEIVQPDPFLARYAVITINEKLITKINWETTYLSKNDNVIVRTVPIPAGGGGGGGKDPMRIVLTIAVIVASIYTGGAAGAAAQGAGWGAGGIAVANAAATMAVMTVGTLAINALIPPPTQSLDGASPSPESYSLETASNTERIFQPIPIVLGYHRMIPPLAASTYTEVLHNDQYLKMCVTWGYGRVSISDLKIGETDIADIPEIEYETSDGYSGDADLKLYPQQVAEDYFSLEFEYDGTWIERTTENNTDIIAFDVTFNGLTGYNSTQNRVKYTVNFEYQWSIAGSGSWSSSIAFHVTSARAALVRRTRIIDSSILGSRGQFDIRVKRTTGEFSYEPGITSVIDDGFLTCLRSITNEDPIDTPFPLARTAIWVKASQFIFGRLDNLSGLCKTYCLDWTGSAWVAGVTNNPAALFRYVLQCEANANPVADGDIDLTQLVVWNDFCNDKGLTYNAIISNRSSVKIVLDNICSAGRARRVLNDGKWSVIIDTEQTIVRQHFSPRNTWDISSSKVFKETPNAWRIPFNNEDQDYAIDEMMVYDDGYDESTATNIEQLQLPGVTNPDQIYQLGRYHLAVARLRPEVHSFNADIEHIVCKRGDLVRLAMPHALIGVSQGRIKDIDTFSENLVGYWAFDEGTGAIAEDGSGNGNDGVIDGAIYKTGVSGTCLDFDYTTDDHVNIADFAELDFGTGDFSISCWAKINAFNNQGSAWNCILYRGAISTTVGSHYGLSFTSLGTIRFTAGDSDYQAQGDADLIDGKWHHIIGIRESGITSIYIDTVKGTIDSTSAVNIAFTYPLVIGGDTGTDKFLDGSVDEVRLYNTALTSDQISALYNNPGGKDQITLDEKCTADVSSRGLVGFWKMDEGSGTQILDSSGNDNTGTITGASWGAGVSGTCLDFDYTTDDHVNIADFAELDFGTGDFSISFHAKINAFNNQGSTYNCPLYRGAIAAGSQYGFSIDTNGEIQFIIGETTNSASFSTFSLLDSTWHHIIGVRESGVLNIYVDTTKGVAGASTQDISFNYPFVIGGDTTISRYLDGSVDEVRLYNRALSTSEIAILYTDTSDIDYELRVRHSDGETSVYEVDSVSEDGYELTMASMNISDPPDVGDLCFFGIQDLETIECVVKSITPQSDYNAKLEVVDYAPGIFTAAEGTIPAWDSQITPLDRPGVPVIEQVTSDESVMVRSPGGGLETRVVINLRAVSFEYTAEVYQQIYGEDDYWLSEIVATTADQITLTGFEDGITYSIKVRYFDKNKLPGEYTTIIHEVKGQLSAPSGLSNFTLSSIGGMALLRWDKLSEIDVIYGGRIEFRHAQLSTNTWSESISIGESAKGADTFAVLPLKAGIYFARVFDAGGRPCETGDIVNFYTKQATALTYANLTSLTESSTGFNGTHDDTQENVSGYLEIDQSSDALAGTYTFQSGIDLSSVKRFRLTTLIKVSIINNTSTIDDRATFIDTWEDFDNTSNATGTDATVYVRTTDDDPSGSPTWTDYQRIDSGEFYARAMSFKIELETISLDFNINIEELIMNVEEVA